jgi:hypothetical protein
MEYTQMFTPSNPKVARSSCFLQGELGELGHQAGGHMMCPPKPPHPQTLMTRVFVVMCCAGLSWVKSLRAPQPLTSPRTSNPTHKQPFLFVICVQVELGELDEATYRRIMGVQRQDLREPELPEGMGVEPE